MIKLKVLLINLDVIEKLIFRIHDDTDTRNKCRSTLTQHGYLVSRQWIHTDSRCILLSVRVKSILSLKTQDDT